MHHVVFADHGAALRARRGPVFFLAVSCGAVLGCACALCAPASWPVRSAFELSARSGLRILLPLLFFPCALYLGALLFGSGFAAVLLGCKAFGLSALLLVQLRCGGLSAGAQTLLMTLPSLAGMPVWILTLCVLDYGAQSSGYRAAALALNILMLALFLAAGFLRLLG